jgi:hypothetical protein
MAMWARASFANVARAKASLSEGFCPDCHHRLQSTDPPWLYCSYGEMSWHVADGQILMAAGQHPPPPPPLRGSPWET